MGSSLSCKRLSPISQPSKLKKIRIIHFNGYIEELEPPLTAAELTSKLPTSHFLFTQSQLLSIGSKPLKFDAVLEAGKVYFLLPYSLLDSKVSAADLAPIARKLASMAQNSKPRSAVPGKENGAVWSSPGVASPVRSSTGGDGDGDGDGEVLTSSKSRSWKPILATIREISFNRRSESDLQDDVNV